MLLIAQRRIAQSMRLLADRLDPQSAPRLIGWSFTFEEGRGIVFRDDERGCRIAYLGNDEYERSWSESDTFAWL